jgi:hypothetical protein
MHGITMTMEGFFLSLTFWLVFVVNQFFVWLTLLLVWIGLSIWIHIGSPCMDVEETSLGHTDEGREIQRE